MPGKNKNKATGPTTARPNPTSYETAEKRYLSSIEDRQKYIYELQNNGKPQRLLMQRIGSRIEKNEMLRKEGKEMIPTLEMQVSNIEGEINLLQTKIASEKVELKRLGLEYERIKRKQEEQKARVNLLESKLDDEKKTLQNARTALNDKLAEVDKLSKSITDDQREITKTEEFYKEKYQDKLDKKQKELKDKKREYGGLLVYQMHEKFRVDHSKAARERGVSIPTSTTRSTVTEEQLGSMYTKLENELKFFESLLNRAKSIALSEPFVSHALLEMAKYEHLNHENSREFRVTRQELWEHLQANALAATLNTQQRHFQYRAMDKRLEFLDSMVRNRRNSSSAQDTDEEWARMSMDYCAYCNYKVMTRLQQMAPTYTPTNQEHTFLSYQMQGLHHHDLNVSNPREYFRRKEEWEYQLTCEMEANTHLSRDPVLSQILTDAKTAVGTTFHFIFDDRDIADSFEGVEKTYTIRDWITLVSNNENVTVQQLDRFLKASAQYHLLIEMSQEVKDSELSMLSSEQIREDYVEGDVIEPYIRKCLTYKRESAPNHFVEYPINCSYAKEVMFNKKKEIKKELESLDELMKQCDDFRGTGKEINDNHVQTIQSFVPKRRDFLHRILAEYQEAMKERLNAESRIGTDTDTYIEGLTHNI